MSTWLPMAELPLLDASEPVAGALGGLGAYPGLVAGDHSGFRFHHAGELAQAIAPITTSPSHFPAFSLADVPGRFGGLLTPAHAAAAAFDPLAPRPELVAMLCENLQADFLVVDAPSLQAGGLIKVYAHPEFDMRIARRIYRCSAFGEAYDEQVYRSTGGDCPVHKHGRLT
jgi:hypothetical protein